jgi:hypothetical protein
LKTVHTGSQEKPP